MSTFSSGERGRARRLSGAALGVLVVAVSAVAVAAPGTAQADASTAAKGDINNLSYLSRWGIEQSLIDSPGFSLRGGFGVPVDAAKSGHGPFSTQLRFDDRDPPEYFVVERADCLDAEQLRLDVSTATPGSWSAARPAESFPDVDRPQCRRFGSEYGPSQPGAFTVTPDSKTGAPRARVAGYDGEFLWPDDDPSLGLLRCKGELNNCEVKIADADLAWASGGNWKLELENYSENFGAGYVSSGDKTRLLASGTMTGPVFEQTVSFSNPLPPLNNILAVGNLPGYSTLLTTSNTRVKLSYENVDAYGVVGETYTRRSSSALLGRTSAAVPAPPTVDPPTWTGPQAVFTPAQTPPAPQINVVEPPRSTTTPPQVPDVPPPPATPPAQLPVTGLLSNCPVQGCNVSNMRFPADTGRVRLILERDSSILADTVVSGTEGSILFPSTAVVSPGDNVRAEAYDPRTSTWVKLGNIATVGSPSTQPGYDKAMRCTADSPTTSPRGTCKAIIADPDAAAGTQLDVCLYAVAPPERPGSIQVGCTKTDTAGLVQFTEHRMTAGTEFYVEVTDIEPAGSLNTTPRKNILSGRTLTPRIAF